MIASHRIPPYLLVGVATIVLLASSPGNVVAETTILEEDFPITFSARGWRLMGESRSPRQIIDMEHQAGGAGSAELRSGPDQPALLAHQVGGDLETATLQIWVHDSAASSTATEVLLSSTRIPGQPESSGSLLTRLHSDALRFVRDCGSGEPSWELRQGERVLATRPITNASPNHWSRLTFEREERQTRVWFRGELIAEGGVWPGRWATLAIVNPAGCDLPARVDDLLVHTGESQVERQTSRGFQDPRVTAEEVRRRGVTVRAGLTALDMEVERTFGTPGVDDREARVTGVCLAVSEFGGSRFGFGAELTFLPDALGTNLGMLSVTGTVFPFAKPLFVEAGAGAVLASGGGEGRSEVAGSDTGAGGHLAMGLWRPIAPPLGFGIRAEYRYYYFGEGNSPRGLGAGIFVTFSPGS